MHDPGFVCSHEATPDSDGDLDDPVERNGLVPCEVAERLALDVLGGNEVVPLGLSDLIDRKDVRMVENRRPLRFLLKPRDLLLIFGEMAMQELESYFPMQTAILCEENLALPPDPSFCRIL